jgi:hypothetical protein
MSTLVTKFDRMLCRVATRYRWCGPDQYDDLCQEARLAAVQAERAYVPAGPASLPTVAHRYARTACLHYADRQVRQPDSLGRLGEKAEQMLPAREGFDLTRLLSEVGEDAATAVRLALEAPGELTPRAAKRRLQLALAGLGWGWQRIARVWVEIREALA